MSLRLMQLNFKKIYYTGFFYINWDWHFLYNAILAKYFLSHFKTIMMFIDFISMSDFLYSDDYPVQGQRATRGSGLQSKRYSLW